MLPVTIVMIAVCAVLAGVAVWMTIIIRKRRGELALKQKELLNLQDDIDYKQSHLDNLTEESKKLDQQIVTDRFQVDALATRKKELNADIAGQVENIERLKTSYQTTQEEFEKKYMSERKEWLQERQEEYLQMQEDFVAQFREDNKKKLAAAQELSAELDQLKSSVEAATEVAKRHAEEENFEQFHSLQITERAMRDIRQLEEIVPGISTEAGEAIAKVIWKVYYEKPYTDLIGRVIGSGRHTGIYRISSRQTKMCYVGQAVDIADRWRQHIKRALNAEPRTQNKLYPAMYEQGLENFTFEIIEECDQSKLNEREDYWQDFYKAKEYGYSIK